MIGDLEANIAMGRLAQNHPSNQPSQIYDMLAKKDLDVAFRNKFLKPYRLTDEGLQLLRSTLNYAKQMEQHAISKVKQDPYDRSGYDDYQEKAKIPKRVIGDLEANIAMGRLMQTNSFWHQKNPGQNVDIGHVPAPGFNH